MSEVDISLKRESIVNNVSMYTFRDIRNGHGTVSSNIVEKLHPWYYQREGVFPEGPRFPFFTKRARFLDVLVRLFGSVIRNLLSLFLLLLFISVGIKNKDLYWWEL